MADFVAQLARKWCVYCRGGRKPNPMTDHHYHEAIAAAIREALEQEASWACSLCHCVSSTGRKWRDADEPRTVGTL